MFAVLAATAIGFSAPAFAQTPKPVAEPAAVPADPLMAQRLTTIPKKRPWPTSYFQPQELVKGSVVRGAMPKVTGHSIDPKALAAAHDYAMKGDTDALLVWRDGKLEQAEFANGVKPSDRLNTYYMHYTVLSLLYGIAIQERKIGSVDDPVGKYLPEWANDARGKITLRQFLTMSSGMEMYHDSTDPKSKAARLFFGSDSTTAALEYQAVSPPDTIFQYNYFVPELLGIVLERAVGMRYVDYLSTRLWKPLGNGDATVWLDRPGGRPHYNSSLFSAAEDWLNVGKLIINNGKVGTRQVVPASWITTMRTPSKTSPLYGMIWFGNPYTPERFLAPDVKYTVKSSAPINASDIMFIDGYGGQRVYIVPSKKLLIVRIGLTRRDWDEQALPNAVLAGIK